MPKNVTVYRVFVGSPGGLEAERRRFREVLDKFNRVMARRHDVEFEPVGWEDTLPGVGRPQAQINEDLERCDYAVFAFHDRWGSKTGNGNLVGTEEEWEIAQRLYSAEGGYQIRQMALYFKEVPAAQLKDPGEELRKVLAFKEKVFADKQHLCRKFDHPDAFAENVEHHLSDWLKKHLSPPTEATYSGVTDFQKDGTTHPSSAFEPDFDFWFGEFLKATTEDPPNPTVALDHLGKALKFAGTHEQQATVLYNQGVAMGNLERSAEAIAVYDELIATFGRSKLPALQARVAMALFNKGCRLSQLNRSADEIAVYDDLIERFRTSHAPALQERVSKALFNKGITLRELGRFPEEIGTYDDLIDLFGASNAPMIQERVAKALVNKGFRLGQLGHSPKELATYDYLIERYGTSDTPALRVLVAMALFNKSCALAELGQISKCIKVLEQWADKRGGFDCEQVAKDSDFDAIRHRPKFVKYLKSKGCVI